MQINRSPGPTVPQTPNNAKVRFHHHLEPSHPSAGSKGGPAPNSGPVTPNV